MKQAAVILLAAGVMRHYGYYLAPDEFRSQAWNVCAALIVTALVWRIAWRWKATVLVAIWWTFEEVQVAVCSALWMWRQWVVKAGEDQCSALLGFDLSSIGLLMIGGLLVWLLRTADK
jgi:hypothetical protein